MLITGKETKEIRGSNAKMSSRPLNLRISDFGLSKHIDEEYEDYQTYRF